jgi:YVTN family beta-propeller protein
MLVMAALSMSCGKDPQGIDGGFFPAEGRFLFVVNGLSETLSGVSLEDYVAFNNVLSLGRWPNGIEADPQRNVLYVVNSGDNNVMEIDLATGKVANSIDIGIGRNPWECAWGGGLLWVSAFLTGELIAVDPVSGSAAHYSVGTTLQAVAVTPEAVYVSDTAYQYGSFGTGMVIRLDPVSGAQTGSATVGTNPQDILADGSGRLHVICSGSFTGSGEEGEGELHVLDAATMVPLDTLFLGGNPSSLAEGRGGVVYAAGYWGGLMSYDGNSLSVLNDAASPIMGGEGYMDIAFDEETGKLFIADFDEDRVMVMDPLVGGTPERVLGVSDGPVRLLVVERSIPEEKQIKEECPSPPSLRPYEDHSEGEL